MKKYLIITAIIALASCSRNKEATQNYSGSTAPATEEYKSAANQNGSKAFGDNNLKSTIVSTDKSSDATQTATTTAIATSTSPINIQSKIIRTANLRMQVSSTDTARKLLTSLATQYNGYLENEHGSNTNEQSETEIIIRIPNAVFEKFVDNACTFGSFIENKNISTENVNDEYVDVEARLKTKRAVHQRYLDLLNRAGKISDILDVEAQARQVEEEIESAEARLRAMDNRISYSTVKISIYELKPVASLPQVAASSKLVTAFLSGWHGLTYFVIAMVSVWPLLLFVVGIVFVYKKRMSLKF